jgi:hypothetical protein
MKGTFKGKVTSLMKDGEMVKVHISSTGTGVASDVPPYIGPDAKNLTAEVVVKCREAVAGEFKFGQLVNFTFSTDEK